MKRWKHENWNVSFLLFIIHVYNVYNIYTLEPQPSFLWVITVITDISGLSWFWGPKVHNIFTYIYIMANQRFHEFFHASISMTSSSQGELSKNSTAQNFEAKLLYSVLHETAAQTMTDVFVDAAATNWTSGAFYQAHSIVLKAEPFLVVHHLFQDAIKTSIRTFNGHFTAQNG